MAKTKPAASRHGEEGASLSRHLMKVVAATLILIAFVVLAGLVVMLLIPAGQPAIKTPAVMKHTGADGLIFEIYPEEGRTTKPGGTSLTPPARSPDRPPRIAIIIDDMGYDKNLADQFMALDPALTLSILPDSPFHKQIAAAARQSGNEIMLHLPMEPLEYPAVDPGPGVLLAAMPPDALIAQLQTDIAGVPFIKGVNNHMGSRLTAESTRLYQIFTLLKQKDLFFIDSRTTEKSLCGPSARKLQVPFAERDVFLDNSLSEADIEHQINRLINIAGHKGKAIGIAHPHPETCRVLRRRMASIKQRAQLVPASALVVTDQP